MNRSTYQLEVCGLWQGKSGSGNPAHRCNACESKGVVLVHQPPSPLHTGLPLFIVNSLQTGCRHRLAASEEQKESLLLVHRKKQPRSY